jgi:hypothetical protein
VAVPASCSPCFVGWRLGLNINSALDPTSKPVNIMTSRKMGNERRGSDFMMTLSIINSL